MNLHRLTYNFPNSFITARRSGGVGWKAVWGYTTTVRHWGTKVASVLEIFHFCCCCWFGRRSLLLGHGNVVVVLVVLWLLLQYYDSQVPQYVYCYCVQLFRWATTTTLMLIIMFCPHDSRTPSLSRFCFSAASLEISLNDSNVSDSSNLWENSRKERDERDY